MGQKMPDPELRRHTRSHTRAMSNMTRQLNAQNLECLDTSSPSEVSEEQSGSDTAKTTENLQRQRIVPNHGPSYQMKSMGSNNILTLSDPDEMDIDTNQPAQHEADAVSRSSLASSEFEDDSDSDSILSSVPSNLSDPDEMDVDTDETAQHGGNSASPASVASPELDEDDDSDSTLSSAPSNLSELAPLDELEPMRDLGSNSNAELSRFHESSTAPSPVTPLRLHGPNTVVVGHYYRGKAQNAIVYRLGDHFLRFRVVNSDMDGNRQLIPPRLAHKYIQRYMVTFVPELEPFKKNVAMLRNEIFKRAPEGSVPEGVAVWKDPKRKYTVKKEVTVKESTIKKERSSSENSTDNDDDGYDYTAQPVRLNWPPLPRCHASHANADDMEVTAPDSISFNLDFHDFFVGEQTVVRTPSHQVAFNINTPNEVLFRNIREIIASHLNSNLERRITETEKTCAVRLTFTLHLIGVIGNDWVELREEQADENPTLRGIFKDYDPEDGELVFTMYVKANWARKPTK